jgi:hypothetical protein
MLAQVPQEGSVVLSIDSYVWQSADAWRPGTQVSLGLRPRGLEVAFRVQDQYVLARTQEYDGPVYLDSCVEFFFQPNRMGEGPYFNIEINAAGGVKFNRQASRGVERVNIPSSVLLDLAVDPGTVIAPEHTGPMSWFVQYTIDFDALSEFTTVDREGWRGNFYKCVEENSHPHFGSWAPIGTDKPDFHRPEFFGSLLFK